MRRRAIDVLRLFGPFQPYPLLRGMALGAVIFIVVHLIGAVT